ncbi:hypothetical protein ACFSM5_11345 [Lacibacterium aquatile]|uniref:Uncharacterized protein n=1 Tax=Lacibacterium aquatile TaxID=1168082 RepID=A0ABW5DW56_9PROT
MDERLLPWMFAVETQADLLNRFDAAVINRAAIDKESGKPKKFTEAVPDFRAFYGLKQGTAGKFIKDKPDIFAQVCYDLFKEEPADLAEANERWQAAVAQLKTEATSELKSATMKAYWFFHPTKLTMYDRLAQKGMASHLKARAGGKRAKPTVNWRNFLSYFQDIYDENKATIQEAITFSGTGYPYPMRVLDKYLWLQGNKDRDDYLDCYALSRQLRGK